MSEYVLEILDGDQAGTIVELRGDKLRIGRRPDNDLVMRDEKCSGHHAEVVVEDGRHVLRDLGSTNGTMIDERRITEIALTAGDVFQLGRVRVAFRVAGEAVVASGDDPALAVGTIDASRLQRSRRRRGSLLFGVLFLLVVVAGGAFLFVSRDGGGGPRVGRKDLPPLAIPGNKLPAGVGDFEGDAGWDVKAVADGLAFEPVVGRTRAHTGTTALVAVGAKNDGGARFALARLSDPVAVAANQPLHVTAFVRTGGNGRVALRALFSASGGEVPTIRTGSAPSSAADWAEVGFGCRVPRGADRVAIELLAFVTTETDEVLVDDVGVLAEGDAPAVQANAGGVVAVGTGASVRVDAAKAPIVLGIEPMVPDGPFADLARRGLLVMSDLGVALSLTGDERGFAFDFTGGEIEGLRLLLPAESASPRLRGGDSTFATAEADFSGDQVTGILLGGSDNRALIHFEGPIRARGKPYTGAWSVELPGSRKFAIQVVFGPEVLAANNLLREARTAQERGKPGEALEQLDRLIATAPHYVETLRSAQTLRSELLAEQEHRLDALLRDGDEATFFESQAGYRRVLTGLEEIERDYAPVGVVRASATKALGERMREGLAAGEARAARERSELLKAMSDAFDQAGDANLAKLVRDYQARVAPAATGGNGDGDKPAGGK